MYEFTLTTLFEFSGRWPPNRVPTANADEKTIIMTTKRVRAKVLFAQKSRIIERKGYNYINSCLNMALPLNPSFYDLLGAKPIDQ
jgi:hypothetical protein